VFRQQDFPLNNALQEVLHQGATRARELRDAQQQLHALQVHARTHTHSHCPGWFTVKPTLFRLLQHFLLYQFIPYSLENGDKHEQNSKLWTFDWFCPSVGLSHMNYVEYLSAVKLNYTIRQYQFSSTSDQSMLHVVQCVCKEH